MIEIINYEDRYQPDFKRLNLQWLDKFELTESYDLEILNDPRGIVLDKGGRIYLAMDGSRVIGTAGLWKESEHEFELVKMAVDEEYRGKGISKLLLEKCVEEAKALQASKLFLFSSTKLQTALRLYERYGFKAVDVTGSHFQTADVKMELSLTPN
ncbi:MAG: GNAT family N-acetyltransferase [Bacteroidetes bacterium]|nr:GNAT family N-acetyltransferase [Bacteroidota bacterium]